LYKIKRVLEEKKGVQDNLDNARLVQERLPPCYYQYQDVFSKTAAEELLEHWPYDHKIILEEPLPNSYSLLYKQNVKELEATKLYV
jgi:lysine/ornithine N-monooxygenase